MKTAADIEAEHVDALAGLDPAQKRAVEREIRAACAAYAAGKAPDRGAYIRAVFQVEADVGCFEPYAGAFHREEFGEPAIA